MAKKNVKKEKSMQDYYASQKKLNKSAKIMAIFLVGVMLVFTIVSAVAPLFSL